MVFNTKNKQQNILMTKISINLVLLQKSTRFYYLFFKMDTIKSKFNELKHFIPE